MISDVLHDAIEEIEDYQEHLPELYDPVRDQIEFLKKSMWALIFKLNTPPGR